MDEIFPAADEMSVDRCRELLGDEAIYLCDEEIERIRRCADGAVIYVRVSTKEQTENLSLATQLKACEDYCDRQAFHILTRFREEGESAKTADRTELQKLLQFCRKNKGAVQFVVVFNLTRFARDKFDHFALRAHLKSLGISLRSASWPSQSAFYRARRTCGFTRRSLRSSGCSRCAFRTEFASTGGSLLEPAQRCRFSST